MNNNAAVYPLLVWCSTTNLPDKRLLVQALDGSFLTWNRPFQVCRTLKIPVGPFRACNRPLQACWTLMTSASRKHRFHVVIISSLLVWNGPFPTSWSWWSDDPRCKSQTISSRIETVRFWNAGWMLAICDGIFFSPQSRPLQDLPDPLTKQSKM